jgi:hypothetical protein
MTKFIIDVSKDGAKEIKFDLDNNYVFIGSVWSEKAEVLDYKRVTKKLIDDTTDKVMDIITEGGHGETQLNALQPEVRKVIRDMLFRTEEEVT